MPRSSVSELRHICLTLKACHSEEFCYFCIDFSTHLNPVNFPPKQLNPGNTSAGFKKDHRF